LLNKDNRFINRDNSVEYHPDLFIEYYETLCQDPNIFIENNITGELLLNPHSETWLAFSCKACKEGIYNLNGIIILDKEKDTIYLTKERCEIFVVKT